MAWRGTSKTRVVFVQRRGHHPLFKGDAVIERRQLDHPIVVVFENSVAVAGLEGCAHDGGLADLGRDIADFDDIGFGSPAASAADGSSATAHPTALAPRDISIAAIRAARDAP